jgi:hypothetical protein
MGEKYMTYYPEQNRTIKEVLNELRKHYDVGEQVTHPGFYSKSQLPVRNWDKIASSLVSAGYLKLLPTEWIPTWILVSDTHFAIANPAEP